MCWFRFRFFCVVLCACLALILIVCVSSDQFIPVLLAYVVLAEKNVSEMTYSVSGGT